jgi:hypothetical protein
MESKPETVLKFKFNGYCPPGIDTNSYLVVDGNSNVKWVNSVTNQDTTDYSKAKIYNSWTDKK